MISIHGQLNLSTSQLKAMLNIVHIEGQLKAYADLTKKFKSQDDAFKYQIVMRSLTDQLDLLTGNLAPNKLLQSWSVSDFSD